VVSGKSKRVEEMNYFELIAWLGIGSSHPGGFPATLQNLRSLQVKAEDLVLDAGCGTGLTACHLAKMAGCKIIGIDLSPEMVEKARQRAEKEGVSSLVEFRVADVFKLPFDDNYFDVVMGESITVFLDKVQVYREFYRVLKPEGRIADLEMALLGDLSPGLRKQMEECFGSSTNPLPPDDWLAALTEAGFLDVEIKNPQRLKSNGNVIVNALKNDWMLIKDLTTKFTSQPGLYSRLQKNAGFMKQNRHYFGFGLMYGRKPTPPSPPERVGIKGWVQKGFSNLIDFRNNLLFPKLKH